jgi:hypothetical protein
MIDDETPIASLFERAEDYSKTTIKLLKLKAIDKSADVASSIVARIVVITTVVFSILIISIGVALWLGKLLGDVSYGFFIVGAFYALMAIFFHLFRKHLVKYPISNTIIKKLLAEKIL